MIGACALSAVIGAAIGVGITCCCVVAGKTDRSMEVPDTVVKRNYGFELESFKKATEPAVAWFKENCNPHQRIIIEMDGAEVVSGEMAYPIEIPD